jgi:hypothetical protein
VGDFRASLALAETWLPKLERFRILIAVQDGAQPDDVRPWLGPSVGIAIGGRPVSRDELGRGVVDWKESSARMWGELARERACYLHMLRVNTARRMNIAAEAQCDSFDGTSASRFRATLPLLDRSRRQQTIRWR